MAVIWEGVAEPLLALGAAWRQAELWLPSSDRR